MPLCYLAHPIDLGEMDLRPELAARVMVELGFTVYMPNRAMVTSGVPDGKVQRVNRAALEEADVVFALLSEKTPSVGVPAEIGWALDAGKPVVLANDIVGSWYLAGWKEAANFRSVGLSPKQIRKGGEWLLHTYNDIFFGTAEPTPSKKTRTLTEASSGAKPQAMVFEEKTPGAQLPERAYGTDAGFDLFTSVNTVLMPGKTTYVPTGVAVDVPDGWWGLVCGRSSTKAKLGLDVVHGVIDEGFSGELLAGVFNPHKHMVNALKGDRLAQIVFIPAIGEGEATWGKVRPKPRGGNGFGSSGKGEMKVEPLMTPESPMTMVEGPGIQICISGEEG